MKSNLVKLSRYPAPLRLLIFLLILLALWVPIALPISWLIKDANLETILTMGLLFVEFLLLLNFWSKKVYLQPHLFKSYGLEITRKNGLELLLGLSIGSILVLCLFGVQGLLGWVTWQGNFSIAIALEGMAIAIGIGFAEELVFRGWLLDELQRDYPRKASLWADAAIFALLHFIKPLPEIIRTFITFPALLLLGLTLVWAKRSGWGRLGLPIGLHAGLVWGYYIINVGQLLKYSGKVPEWVTGIDKNPLAGVMGLLFLGAIASAMWKSSQKRLH